MMRGVWAIAAALALLAGCGLPDRALRSVTGDPPAASLGREEGELARLLADPGTPKVVLRIPARGVAVTMLLAGTRAGVQRWRTTDNVQIYTRGGMILGTRGLGHDVMTVDSGAAAALIAADADGQITRMHRVLTGDDLLELQSWVCDIAPAGAERLRVGEDAWAEARVITETCHGPRGPFENRHWVVAGVLRQSWQYVGPEIGVIQLLFLP